MKNALPLMVLICSTCAYAQTQIKEVDNSGEQHKLKGSVAPDFKSRTLDEKEFQLSSLKGKIVLIDFWSLGCAACYMEIVDFNALLKKYPNDKFVIVSLTDNPREELLSRIKITPDGYRLTRAFFKNDKIDFQIIPGALEIMKLYDVKDGFPHNFILDTNGEITFYMGGYAPNYDLPDQITSMDFFTKEIDRLLTKQK